MRQKTRKIVAEGSDKKIDSKDGQKAYLLLKDLIQAGVFRRADGETTARLTDAQAERLKLQGVI